MTTPFPSAALGLPDPVLLVLICREEVPLNEASIEEFK